MIVALVMVSCGSDDSCDAPITITSGFWCLEINQKICNQPLDPSPYTMNFNQDGSILNVTTQHGYTFEGTICGNTVTMTDLYGGITSMGIAFSNANSATGSIVWDGVCTGTETFIAVPGFCP